MIDLLEKQASFVQDDIPTRLGKLAQHLAQIRSSVSATNLSEAMCLSNSSEVYSLIRESQFFLEWTVPQIAQTNIDRAEELVELVRTLANWKYNWTKICSDAASLTQVATTAGIWSERVLAIAC